MFCNEQSTSVEDNDEMKELLGIHYVSISLCPGVAHGAWKHAPIIPLPNYHALIVHAHPFQLSQPNSPVVSELVG